MNEVGQDLCGERKEEYLFLLWMFSFTCFSFPVFVKATPREGNFGDRRNMVDWRRRDQKFSNEILSLCNINVELLLRPLLPIDSLRTTKLVLIINNAIDKSSP